MEQSVVGYTRHSQDDVSGFDTICRLLLANGAGIQSGAWCEGSLTHLLFHSLTASGARDCIAVSEVAGRVRYLTSHSSPLR